MHFEFVKIYFGRKINLLAACGIKRSIFETYIFPIFSWYEGVRSDVVERDHGEGDSRQLSRAWHLGWEEGKDEQSQQVGNADLWDPDMWSLNLKRTIEKIRILSFVKMKHNVFFQKTLRQKRLWFFQETRGKIKKGWWATGEIARAEVRQTEGIDAEGNFCINFIKVHFSIY